MDLVSMASPYATLVWQFMTMISAVIMPIVGMFICVYAFIGLCRMFATAFKRLFSKPTAVAATV